MDAKLIEIGNSKGLRIPKKLIEKYQMVHKLEIIEKETGILIKPKEGKSSKLSWEATFKEMKKEKENWLCLDSTLLDGIE